MLEYTMEYLCPINYTFLNYISVEHYLSNHCILYLSGPS